MKTTADIRQAFLDYFAECDHHVVPSSALIPANDPTLLFTNAGMVQFKDVFLGSEKRAYTRATSSQRCVRAGGKHNDLENVGYTARHHTFFEMLGNFSFGDYFKQEAIEYAWEFLTETCQLPPEKLWVTVYEDDDEAAGIWLNHIGVDPERFSRIGDKPGKRYESDNFWAMGETGPCGPCTEIFYDHGPDVPGGPPGTPEEDGDRYIEIWNLVFMQYDRAADGTMSPLPAPCVDTGMGLERLAAILQGMHSNYEIDLFEHLIDAAMKHTGASDRDSASLKVIADHIRACAFLIVDGVLPSNEGRGYVLRRIIRRAIRHGYKLGCEDLFFAKMVAPLAEVMGQAYPELADKQQHVTEVLEREEKRFGETLDQGMKILLGSMEPLQRLHDYLKSRHGPSVGAVWPTDSRRYGTVTAKYGAEGGKTTVRFCVPDGAEELSTFVSREAEQFLRAGNAAEDLSKKLVIGLEDRDLLNEKDLEKRLEKLEQSVELEVISLSDVPLSGEVAFKLYDTFGFPIDMTMDVAREHGIDVDETGFEAAMNAQRERARAAGKFGAADGIPAEVIAGLRATHFLGYQYHETESSEVVAILVDGKPVDELHAGEEGVIILDRTPFYAESGGQVGDTGLLEGHGARFDVADTRKLAGAYHGHIGRLASGTLERGATVSARIDSQRRADIVRHHSATHLLHSALRTVLGEHVQQKGSLVAPDRLRFDFSHHTPVTEEEIAEIEHLVNEQIQANAAAEAKEMSFDAAMDAGALAFFDEKYGDEVRVLRFGDFSMELCGGTHVDRAGDIGLFKIVSETGISAGVRRVEAVAGRVAVDWLQGLDRSVRRVSGQLKASPEQLGERVEQLLKRSRELEKELERLKGKLASAAGSDLASQAVDFNGVKVLAAYLEGVDPNGLRDTVDQLKNKLGSAVIVLGTAAGGGVRLVAGVTKDLTDRIKAGELVNHVASQVGGKGGGRPDFAQAGGKDAEALPGALESAPDWIRGRL